MKDLTVMPLSVAEWIEWLENLYPETTPSVEELKDPLACAAKAGQRELIRMLRAKFDYTEQNALKGE